MDELNVQLGEALASAFSGDPTVRVLDPRGVMAALSKHEIVQSFSRWRSAYVQTLFLDRPSLSGYRLAVGTRYLLLIRDVDLDREKIRAIDSGRGGFVSDANNVWRTTLRVRADLSMLRTGP